MEEYGLELTNNSKAGWAFSLPRSATCIGATEICRKVCYGNGVRYQTTGQKEKRLRNLRTVELLLSRGGPQLLADNLVDLVDKAKPADWLAASIAGAATQTPWSLRLHDVGDFGSVAYTRAWAMAVTRRPKCAFWFYTRSFVDRDIFIEMTKLASLPNCRGWLSIDSDNFNSALMAYARRPDVWQLALLQEEQEDLPSDLLPALREAAAPKEVVSFPVHRGRYHAVPIADKAIFSCPAVLGLHKLEPSSRKPRPCQTCSFCLPATSAPCSVEE
ncbi:MAG: hypothetical protein HY986_11570 [Candidatus Melainabacteria bacterium]|nr:hypothetical protein [Candidatus Melainabacteria bacterium]